MTLNEWIKKYSPYDVIYTRNTVAEMMGMEINTLKYKLGKGGYELKKNSFPSLKKRKVSNG